MMREEIEEADRITKELEASVQHALEETDRLVSTKEVRREAFSSVDEDPWDHTRAHVQ